MFVANEQASAFFNLQPEGLVGYPSASDAPNYAFGTYSRPRNEYVTQLCARNNLHQRTFHLTHKARIIDQIRYLDGGLLAMSSMEKTVGQFVRNAFPNGTIPYNAKNGFDDFSYNFREEINWIKNWRDQQTRPPDEYLWTQAPVWPADLFAATAVLLERSGAYQRLADDISPNLNRSSGSVEWNKIIKPDAERGDVDPFGVHLPHRLLLRLIGVLWAHGSTIISGTYDKKTDNGIGSVIERNKVRVDEALAFIKARMRDEISDGELKIVYDHIKEQICERFKLKDLQRELNVVLADDENLATSGASYLACKAIVDHDKKLRPADISEAKSYYTGSGAGLSAIGPYCLIIWASEYIQYHWGILRDSNRPVSLSLSERGVNSDDLQWWCAATRLLIIADEAGKGMGFSEKKSLKKPLLAEDLEFHGAKSPQAGSKCRTIWDHNRRADAELRRLAKPDKLIQFPRTLTQCFDDELGAVLPKARTPGNGCTIRSLSHNFALLPPKGRVRARWARQSEPEDRATYNMLIVPYPYQIKSKNVDKDSSTDDHSDWGFFHVRPDWLYDLDQKQIESHSLVGKDSTDPQYRETCRESFWLFLTALLDSQAADTVHAVVLPEGALDWETFQYVASRLPEAFPSVEMLVCGLTSAILPDGDGMIPQLGNYVATFLRKLDSVASAEEGGGRVWPIQHIRAKHHRWKLDTAQLQSYALSHRLAPDKVWWEKIDLPPREMLFAEFSSGSVVTTLICEDLARIEPCQVALRAVGPNLVLVLLMDSAQIVERWPYQYAGVLADDPGSSVITLTSFGLIKRANLSMDWKSREIALWREPHAGPARAIKLPVGYDAQLVSIRRTFCAERTLDGRSDGGDSAIAWKLAGLTPIRTDRCPPGGKADEL